MDLGTTIFLDMYNLRNHFLKMTPTWVDACWVSQPHKPQSTIMAQTAEELKAAQEEQAKLDAAAAANPTTTGGVPPPAAVVTDDEALAARIKALNLPYPVGHQETFFVKSLGKVSRTADKRKVRVALKDHGMRHCIGTFQSLEDAKALLGTFVRAEYQVREVGAKFRMNADGITPYFDENDRMVKTADGVLTPRWEYAQSTATQILRVQEDIKMSAEYQMQDMLNQSMCQVLLAKQTARTTSKVDLDESA
jgi:hypothetical protein